MKNLYLLIADGGDGSQSINFTFDSELVELMENDHDFSVIGECWMSGDGLQVTRLQVPEEMTMECLGVSQWSILDRADFLELFEQDE